MGSHRRSLCHAGAQRRFETPNLRPHPEQLEVVRIEPRFFEGGKVVDMIGIVTTFEGRR